MSIEEPLLLEIGEFPNHCDDRSNLGALRDGAYELSIKREAARILEEQYVAQYKRWHFKDAICKGLVAAEQERSDRAEIERDALRELERAEARVATVRNESETRSKFESS